MPGPRSFPKAANDKTQDDILGNGKRRTRKEGEPSGKTKYDKASGKHARRFVNLHSDPIRQGGGKQFASKR